MDIVINTDVFIFSHEYQLSAIRAQGAGGQNVNKVSSAIHLKFDIKNSSLPDFYKTRLINFNDSRINKDGVVVIKAQEFRTQEKNKMAAIERLKLLIEKATQIKKVRKPTKPSKSSQIKRLNNKTKKSQTKALRSKHKFD